MQAHTALAHSAAGPALLHALGDSVCAATRERLGGACEASWQQRAVDVYREALSTGYTPRPHIIERVLACLRLPATPPSPFKVSLAGQRQRLMASQCGVHISGHLLSKQHDLSASDLQLFSWATSEGFTCRRSSRILTLCTSLAGRRACGSRGRQPR